jgi:hypothetical protein
MGAQGAEEVGGEGRLIRGKRMRMTAPAIGGLAIAFAAALVWLFSPEPPAPLSETGDRAPAAQERVPPVAEPLQVTEAVAPAPADVEQVAPQAPFERAPLPGEMPRRPMAELVAERQNLVTRSGPGAPNRELPENIAAIELEFAKEPIDRTWAPGAEAAIYAGLAQIPGLALIDQRVECRSTTCRLEVTQARTESGLLPFNMGSFQMLRDSLGLEPRWMMMGVGASPAMRSIGYFYREGFSPGPAQHSTSNPGRE